MIVRFWPIVIGDFFDVIYPGWLGSLPEAGESLIGEAAQFFEHAQLAAVAAEPFAQAVIEPPVAVNEGEMRAAINTFEKAELLEISHCIFEALAGGGFGVL